MTESNFATWAEPGTTCLVRLGQRFHEAKWVEVTVTRRTKASVFTTNPYRMDGLETRWVAPSKWSRKTESHLDEYGGSRNSGLYPLDTPVRAEEQERAAAQGRWRPASEKARVWGYGGIPTVEQAREAAAALTAWADQEEALNNDQA